MTAHARLHRYIVINEGDHPETGGRILCAWSDCERFGYSLYVLVRNEGRPTHPRLVRYAFCSQRHLAYFAHSHRENGRLPPGARNLSLGR